MAYCKIFKSVKILLNNTNFIKIQQLYFKHNNDLNLEDQIVFKYN